MLGCSNCTAVQPAWWFPALPVIATFAVLATLGIVLLVTTRPGRRERRGALLVGGAMVALVASLVVAETARTHVYVATTPPPMDSDEWRVTCESAFQSTEDHTELTAPFRDACSDATAGDRLVIYLLLGLSALLLTAGATMLWPTKAPPRRRRPDADHPAASEPLATAPG